MYKEYFGFVEMPFSIVPNARYLFLSRWHREAMSQLQAGLDEGGGFAMLTGAPGTGKTTISKAMQASLAEGVCARLLLTPSFFASELLEAICDEFAISYPESASVKQLHQTIAGYLHTNQSRGIQTLLLIDEAQHLPPVVLEQLRLLSNLETDSQKLMKVLLVGQPELQAKLQTSELSQLAQRISVHYHLPPLSNREVVRYIRFRLKSAGVDKPLFAGSALRIIARQADGVPRLINLMCDKALRYAFYAGKQKVTSGLARQACCDVMKLHIPAMPRAAIIPRLAISSFRYASLAGLVLLAAVHHFSSQWQAALNQYVPHWRITAERFVPQWQAVVERYLPDQALSHARRQLAPFLSAAFPAGAEFRWPRGFVRGAGRAEALQTLYRLWGIRASLLEVDCRATGQAPFICGRRRGTLNQIEKAGRPVMLTLRGENDPLYAVLYACYGDWVELLSSTQRIRLARSALEQHWQGEYVDLWYQASEQILKPGMQGGEVRRLDSMLATAMQENALDTVRFDARLASRVKAFQAWQGLEVDAIAGRNTLRLLDKLTNGNAPVLRTSGPMTGEKQ